ncbi:PEP-CTERM sorting domain-containing protein [Nitrosomonas supralitoralis]|uniref:Ice-binding protein C-terminal domain-containing protein n=1 Tax=Nitrosomonas supralitoralis TaxID=2116706 RepID=A0A2P7NY03_9PROT|nr:PEP-CTERM sorting domain-containing protein [Nitrosomonas supralitoralis]PSJ18342.1 hypothetical protein C7H79_02930 [Nitrosomonas supralitoralis]
MNKLTLGIVAAILSTSANAEYKFIDLHFNGAHPNSQALAINDLNQVVGFEWVKDGPVTWQTPTLWDVESKTSTYLLTPRNNRDAKALDINNRGDVVIRASDNFDPSVSGYIHRSDGIEKLSFPSGMPNGVLNLDLNENGYFIGTTSRFTTTLWNSSNKPIAVYNIKTNALNDRNQMVGQIDIGGPSHETTAALFDVGVTVSLGKGYDWIFSSRAVDINNNSQVLVNGIGFSGGSKSFIWDDGAVRSLQSIGGPSQANSINDFGIVVGNKFVDRGYNSEILDSAAVIWDGHNQYNLNDFLDQETKDAGWILLSANDINNNGWVVGYAINTITEGGHAYALSTDEMLSPIPEPSTYLMLLAGLGLLGFVGRNKQL